MALNQKNNSSLAIIDSLLDAFDNVDDPLYSKTLIELKGNNPAIARYLETLCRRTNQKRHRHVNTYVSLLTELQGTEFFNSPNLTDTLAAISRLLLKHDDIVGHILIKTIEAFQQERLCQSQKYLISRDGDYLIPKNFSLQPLCDAINCLLDRLKVNEQIEMMQDVTVIVNILLAWQYYCCGKPDDDLSLSMQQEFDYFIKIAKTNEIVGCKIAFEQLMPFRQAWRRKNSRQSDGAVSPFQGRIKIELLSPSCVAGKSASYYSHYFLPAMANSPDIKSFLNIIPEVVRTGYIPVGSKSLELIHYDSYWEGLFGFGNTTQICYLKRETLSCLYSYSTLNSCGGDLKLYNIMKGHWFAHNYWRRSENVIEDAPKMMARYITDDYCEVPYQRYNGNVYLHNALRQCVAKSPDVATAIVLMRQLSQCKKLDEQFVKFLLQNSVLATYVAFVEFMAEFKSIEFDACQADLAAIDYFRRGGACLLMLTIKEVVSADFSDDLIQMVIEFRGFWDETGYIGRFANAKEDEQFPLAKHLPTAIARDIAACNLFLSVYKAKCSDRHWKNSRWNEKKSKGKLTVYHLYHHSKGFHFFGSETVDVLKNDFAIDLNSSKLTIEKMTDDILQFKDKLSFSSTSTTTLTPK